MNKNPGRARKMLEAIESLKESDIDHNLEPVKWALLVLQMELLRAQTGMGLAKTWGMLQDEEPFDEVRAHFNSVVDMVEETGRIR